MGNWIMLTILFREGPKSDNGGPAPPSKRREQVRHAQR